MTSTELLNILKLADIEKIREEIYALGFHNTTEDITWDFSFGNKLEDIVTKQTASWIDKSKKIKLYATLIDNDKRYKGFTFINILCFGLNSGKGSHCTFLDMLSFTDMPCNEKRLKELYLPAQCATCGKKNKKRDLKNFRGIILCKNCFAMALTQENNERWQGILNEKKSPIA